MPDEEEGITPITYVPSKKNKKLCIVFMSYNSAENCITVCSIKKEMTPNQRIRLFVIIISILQ